MLHSRCGLWKSMEIGDGSLVEADIVGHAWLDEGNEEEEGK